VAPLTNIATITVQADPAVIGVNTAGSTSQQASLRAVVRDGTPQNNLVKNATVAFSILTDPSGGSLTQPALVPDGGHQPRLNGVQIQAAGRRPAPPPWPA
jgi:hypothetical protein